MEARLPALVIGAGPAGLALSACLNDKGVDHIVLEREDAVASRWREHYDRLHLHTVRGLSSLPHQGFAKGVPRFPSRQQVVDYMDDYAKAFDVRPLFRQEVRRASRVNRHWRVETQDRAFEADNLVVATGYNRSPHAPTWPGQELFAGEILHSRDYRNGAPWKGKRALVIGAGNTGAELALDLYEHGAEVTICIRGPIHIVPREFGGLPTQMTGIALSKLPLGLADRLGRLTSQLAFGDLSKWGITRPEMGPISQIWKLGRIPLIDIGTIDRIRRGEIQVVPGVERFTEEGCKLVSGEMRPFDVVVLATGYRAAIEEFLEDANSYLNDRGYPRVHGAAADPPGPFFVGFGNPPTGQLREINHHAKAVAEKLAQVKT